jgi:D-methionine transport system substrate-binding protein
MQRRRFVQFALAASVGAGTLARPALAADKVYKIGVTAGPHAEIMDFVQKIAAKHGLKLKVVEFSDYVQPNAALAAGDLDANSFQHQPYLDAQNHDRGYKLVSVAKTVTFPLGIYSRKVKSLAELRNGASVGIPNDPTNGGRALLLLQAKGLIQLRPNAGLKATPLDITGNPKHLKIVELDAAQLPRSLSDLDASAVNGNYAASAGLNPVKDAIALEAPDGPYANVIAVRAADKDQPWVKELVAAYRSDATRAFIVKNFGNSVIPAW